ncbi:MAG: GDSL-type esterase/lipase family protein [Paludibacteraceae bacterium]|nr:GDSL-type esterase/lipase family protein [Paludibacteraceae bacterium]
MKQLRPFHIFLFMCCCMLLLAAICYLMPSTSHWFGNEIRTPQLTEVLELEADSALTTTTTTTTTPISECPEAPTTTTTTSECPEATTTKAPTTESPKAPVIDSIDYSVDTRMFLSIFYESLQQADSMPIRVVHYGDSQIEGDRITMQVRRACQQQYGGGGVGLIPLHQTISMRTVSQTTIMNGEVQQTGEGPKRYMIYGPKSNRLPNGKGANYGPMGHVAYMDDSLVVGSEDISVQIKPTGKDKHPESYFNRVRILQSGDITTTVHSSFIKNDNVYTIADNTSYLRIDFKGKGEVYGISLENDHGVTVDNIPMRGCAGTIFTSLSSKQLKDYFSQTSTRLIIMQFGGNVMPYTDQAKEVTQYVRRIRNQVQLMKRLAPNSSILFVGPSDMIERKSGQLRTYAMLPFMEQSLRKMAIEEQIGYFSIFEAMGGEGGMIRWKEQGLAGSDYVHFTRKGADKVGELLAQWLLKQD